MHQEEKFFRRAMEPILNFLKGTSITPEELTLFRIFFGIVTAFVIAIGNYTSSLVFLVFYQFVMMLDYVDGSLARYRKSFKTGWVYLDLMFHVILGTIFLITVSLSYYFSTGSVLFLSLGLLSSTLFVLNNSLNKKSALDRRNDIKRYPQNWKNHRFSPLISWTKIGRPFSLFFILFVLNLHSVLIIFYFVLYLLSSAVKFCLVFRSFENEKQRKN